MTKWISVKDRLPDNDVPVMIYNYDVNIGVYYKNKFHAFDENGYPFEINYVTHWMPLPEPPKEVGHD